MFCSRASWVVWIPHKFCSHTAIIQWSTKLMVGIWTIKERMSTKSITCHLGKSMQSLRFVGLAGWRHLLNQVTRPSFFIFFFFIKNLGSAGWNLTVKYNKLEQPLTIFCCRLLNLNFIKKKNVLDSFYVQWCNSFFWPKKKKVMQDHQLLHSVDLMSNIVDGSFH